MAVSEAQLADILANLAGTPAIAEPPAARPAATCRATGCTERLDPVLIDRADNTGLHALCDEPGQPAPLPEPAPAAAPCDDPFCKDTGHDCGHSAVAHFKPASTAHQYPREDAVPTPPAVLVAPPSTVAYVRDILTRYSASRPRSLQTALGPSELGTPCQRQIAYKLAGTPGRPITDPEWAPLQGIAMHGLMEDALTYENEALARDRWVIEKRLHIDDEIAGNGDALDTDIDTVVDWKYVGTTALKKLRAAKRAGKPPVDQVSPEYRVQAHLYGYGHERAGRKVGWVRLVLLSRSWKYDDSDEWTEAYDPEIALLAIVRYYAIQDLIAALNPTANPILWGAIPAAPSADTCKWCPFQRPGGPADQTGCPGDVEGRQQHVDKFTDGLIAP